MNNKQHISKLENLFSIILLNQQKWLSILYISIIFCLIPILILFDAYHFIPILTVIAAGFMIYIITNSTMFIFYIFILGMFAFNRSFSYFGLSLGSFKIYITEIVMVFFILKNFFLIPIKGKIKEVKTPLDIPFLIYFAIGTIVLLKDIKTYGIESIRDFVLVYYLLFSYIITENVKSFEDLKKMVNICLIGGIFSEIFFFITLSSNLKSAFGPLLSKSIVIAYSLNMSISILFFVTLKDELVKMGNTIFFIMLFFTSTQILAILVGQARSAWVALIVAIIFILFIAKSQRKYILSLVLPVIFIATVLILSYNYFSNSQFLDQISEEFKSIYKFKSMDSISAENSNWRLRSYKIGISEFMKYPLGRGFGIPVNEEVLIKKTNIQADYHNSPLSILVRTGLPGFLAFLSINVLFYYHTIRFCLKTDNELFRNYMIGIVSVHLSIFINSLFFMVLQGPFMGIFYWIFIGLGCALINIEKTISSES